MSAIRPVPPPNCTRPSFFNSNSLDAAAQVMQAGKGGLPAFSFSYSKLLWLFFAISSCGKDRIQFHAIQNSWAKESFIETDGEFMGRSL